MSINNTKKRKKNWNLELIANLSSSLFALGLSIFVLYRTEFNKGNVKVSFPSRVAIASAREIKFQDNDSDKILLSFSIYNTGSSLKTIKEIILTISNPNGEEVTFIADGQFDELKDLNLYRFPLKNNKNYSLVTAFSIPPKTHYIANNLFFYKCDHGWNTEQTLQLLGCENKPNSLYLQPELEYRAKIHVDVFEAKSQDICFIFSLPRKPQSNVLDFSPVHSEIPCPQSQ